MNYININQKIIIIISISIEQRSDGKFPGQIMTIIREEHWYIGCLVFVMFKNDQV